MIRRVSPGAAVFGAALAFGALAPRPARGDDPVPPDTDLTAVVLFSSEGLDPAIVASFGRDLREAMIATREAGKIAVPPVADLAPKNDGMLIVEGQQRLVTARKYLLRGLEYAGAGDRVRAHEEFLRGVHYYRSAYPYAQSDRLYRDLVFYVAATADTQKDPAEATRRWCEHLGLNVEITGAFDYLAKVNEIHDQCDWVIEEEELKILSMATNPPGARVFVDGIFRGITPLQLSDLRRGEHLFTFEREGFRRVTRVMLVGAKFAETRELELGLHLKPGVYQYIYGDLVPVVVAEGPPADDKVLRNTAYALEVGNVLLVLLEKEKEKEKEKGKGKGKDKDKAKRGDIRTLHYAAKTGAIVRKETPVELTEAGLAAAVGQVIEAHFGVTPVTGGERARDAIYFKLEIPPLTVAATE